ncbi:MAG: transcription termination/antitermination protein NusG, partial [Actinomycetota bacterium]|nr:transcription termination/antitermination protein NusG [Actinomycetota bacterium]
MSEYSLPTDEQPLEGPASEQGEAVDGAAGLTETAFAPATEAGTAAADIDELGLGGVEGPSGYLDDAAPEGEPTPAAAFSDAPEVESELAPGAEPEPASDDPADEMRRALAGLPGDWYVVHSYAGYENKVKTNLESRISSLNMEDYIFQIEVPTEE